MENLISENAEAFDDFVSTVDLSDFDLTGVESIIQGLDPEYVDDLLQGVNGEEVFDQVDGFVGDLT